MDELLLQPKQLIQGRGSIQTLVELIQPGPVLLIHSKSVVAIEDLLRNWPINQTPITLLPVSGEPELEQIEQHLEAWRSLNFSTVVGIGGGSAIDYAKAVAALLNAKAPARDYLEIVGRGIPLDHEMVPYIAVPTTVGTGAEATKNAVVKVRDRGLKVSLRDPKMIPHCVVLDADLCDGLPWHITFSTGMDAITQLIEAFLSCKATAQTKAICETQIPIALQALHQLSIDSSLKPERERLQYAAYMSGVALANSGLGVVHGFAAVIGGAFDVAHGAICAQLLPAALSINRKQVESHGESISTFQQLDQMTQSVFGVAERAEESLERFVGNHLANPLPDVLFSEPTMSEMVHRAMQSSSFKGNPVALDFNATLQVLMASKGQ